MLRNFEFITPHLYCKKCYILYMLSEEDTYPLSFHHKKGEMGAWVCRGMLFGKKLRQSFWKLPPKQKKTLVSCTQGSLWEYDLDEKRGKALIFYLIWKNTDSSEGLAVINTFISYQFSILSCFKVYLSAFLQKMWKMNSLNIYFILLTRSSCPQWTDSNFIF